VPSFGELYSSVRLKFLESGQNGDGDGCRRRCEAAQPCANCLLATRVRDPRSILVKRAVRPVKSATPSRIQTPPVADPGSTPTRSESVPGRGPQAPTPAGSEGKREAVFSGGPSPSPVWSGVCSLPRSPEWTSVLCVGPDFFFVGACAVSVRGRECDSCVSVSSE
ncbi:unnamed protein product, partial [Ixodes persulcatus]